LFRDRQANGFVSITALIVVAVVFVGFLVLVYSPWLNPSASTPAVTSDTAQNISELPERTEAWEELQKAGVKPEDAYLVFRGQRGKVTLEEINQRFGSVANFRARAEAIKQNPDLRRKILSTWFEIERAGIIWEEFHLVFPGRDDLITLPEIIHRYGSVAEFKFYAEELKQNPSTRRAMAAALQEIEDAGITKQEVDLVFPGRNDYITLSEIARRYGSIEQFKAEASVLDRDILMRRFASQREKQKLADSEKEGYKRIRREELGKLPPEERLAVCRRARDRLREDFSCNELVESILRQQLSRVAPEERLIVCIRETERMRGDFSCDELVQSMH
jgi:hypothetical protein